MRWGQVFDFWSLRMRVDAGRKIKDLNLSLGALP
jgi:hypothetical protein